MVQPLLEVKGLSVEHRSARGVVKAVDNVSFSIGRGETVGLIGESGSGKSTLARTIVGLHHPLSGRIEFDGHDITRRHHGFISDRRTEMRRRMQMIFQDPVGSLNPRSTVGRIIEEPLSVHRVGTAGERKERVAALLEKVGLAADAAERLPNQFSGGQRQRISIARALALQPDLIICDEPVSALDLSIQAQILNLLTDLQSEFGLSYLFISHDLSVVRHLSDRVLVMNSGNIVEEGSIDILLGSAGHAYTRRLLASEPGRNRKAPKRDVA